MPHAGGAPGFIQQCGCRVASRSVDDGRAAARVMGPGGEVDMAALPSPCLLLTGGVGR